MGRTKIDAPRLKRLTAELAEVDGSTNLPNHINHLKQREGLRIRQTASGMVFASMGSIVGKSLRGEADAVRNWANAARRAILQAGS